MYVLAEVLKAKVRCGIAREQVIGAMASLKSGT